MSRHPEADVVFWTQPLDPIAGDLIEVNGRLLPQQADTRRQTIVGRITAVADRGRRAEVADGAWVTRHKGFVVAQVPTSSGKGEPGAAIITCVRPWAGAPSPDSGELAAGLVEFGQKVGYEVDADLARRAMEEVVRHCRSLPFRLRRRLEAVVRWLFRR